MRSADTQGHGSQPSVSWLPQKKGVAMQSRALYLASLTEDGNRAFATISECDHPAGMWLLTMYPRGRARQFVIYFPALEPAQRAVERWVAHYWQSIEV
jgi:hypothetical protein